MAITTPSTPRPPARLLAAGGVVLAIVIVAAGVLFSRRAPAPATGMTCAGASTQVATLFSDDQTTAIRVSDPDFGNMRILGTAPAAVLPGLFQALLSLSNDNTRLAYVTADDETMANANIWSLDTAAPGQPQLMAHIPTGFWVVKPVWSPDNKQLAYLALDPDLAAQHQTQLVLWVAQAGIPPRKVGSFPQLRPEDFFGDHAVPLCWATDNRTLIFDLAGPGVTTVAPAATSSTASQTTTSGAATVATTTPTLPGAASSTSAGSASKTAPSLQIVAAAPAGPPRQLQIDTVTGTATVASRPTQPQPPLLGGSAPPQPTGSACGMPVFSQNDPTWRFIVMQSGGDAIGPYGCALTSTAMVLNHYGARLTPPLLNACLKGEADPIYWSQVPNCTNGLVSGGTRLDFSWPALDKVLGSGEPAIIGMLRGQTGMHFIVVTSGGGGNAANYAVTDPWDATTNKSLQTFINSGYNLAWIVVYNGASAGCARLVPPPPAQTALIIQGVADGGVYNAPVHVAIGGPAKLTISANVINLSVQAAAPQLSIGAAASTTATNRAVATAASSVGSATGSAATTVGGVERTSRTSSGAATSETAPPSRVPTATSRPSSGGTITATSVPPATVTKTTSAAPTAAKTAKGGQAVTSVPVASSATISQEGVFQLITTGKGSGQGSATKSVKFTIDRTPPTVQVVWQAAPKQAYGPAKLLSPLPAGSLAQSDVPQLATPAQFQVSAVDPLSGVKSIEYQLDGSDWLPYANDVSFHALVQISAPGPHTLGVRATDLAGNTSPPQTFAFNVLPPSGASATATTTATPTATATPQPATPTSEPSVTASPTAAPSPSATETPAPALTFKPAALDFGATPLGATGAAQTLTIAAAGTVPLTIGQMQLGGNSPGDFAIGRDTCSKVTLPVPNGSCTVVLFFTPSQSGARQATLLIPSNTGADPAAVPLQGTGGPATPSTATPTISAGTPTATATAAPSPTAGTPTATATATAAPSPSATPSPSPTATGTATSTPTPTPRPTATFTPVPPAATTAPTATATPPPTATPTTTPTATVAPTATATPCAPFGRAGISGVVDQPNGLVRVSWTSSGGCAPYSGTITAQYRPGTVSTFNINAPSGSLTNPLAQYCSTGGPIVYTLSLYDSSNKNAVAETSVGCPATVTPTPPPPTATATVTVTTSTTTTTTGSGYGIG